jgi:hypothetical protein
MKNGEKKAFRLWNKSDERAKIVNSGLIIANPPRTPLFNALFIKSGAVFAFLYLCKKNIARLCFLQEAEPFRRLPGGDAPVR